VSPFVVVLEVVALVATVAGALWWYVRYVRADADGSGGTRRAIRPQEIGIAGLMCAACLLANAIAVQHVPPLTPTNVGPLALAYHERQPSLVLLATGVLLLFLASFIRGVGRAAVILFVGAATANVVSPLLWDGAVPDYLALTRIDVIANVSDAVMVVTGAIAVVWIMRPRERPVAGNPPTPGERPEAPGPP
jgi:hypothetical protein